MTTARIFVWLMLLVLHAGAAQAQAEWPRFATSKDGVLHAFGGVSRLFSPA